MLRDAVTRLVALSARYRDGHTGYLVSSTPLSTVRAPTLPSAVRLGWSMELSCSLPRVAHHHHGGGAGRGDEGATITITSTTGIITAITTPLSQFHHNHCVLSSLQLQAQNLGEDRTQYIPHGSWSPAPRWTPEVGARPGAELLWSWPLHNTVLPPRRCS